MDSTVKFYFDFENEDDVELVRNLVGNLSDIEEDSGDDFDIRSSLTPALRVGQDIVNDDDDVEDIVTADEISEVADLVEGPVTRHAAAVLVQAVALPETPTPVDIVPPIPNVTSSHEVSALQQYFQALPAQRKTPSVKWVKKSIEDSAPYAPFANAELQIDINETVGSPLQYFRKYIPNEILESTAFCTNLYAQHNEVHNFKPTNINELERFIGLHLIMGTLPYPRVHLFYDTALKIKVFPETMSRDRLFQLRNNVHFTNILEIPEGNRDRFLKVRPLYDSIRKRCLEHPLEEDLAVDEQIVPFKGKLDVKQYVKGKPCPWGIKIFFLCGKSGLPYDFIIYQGATTEVDAEAKQQLGLGAGIVFTLAKRINDGVNHRLYFDNYFSNFHLLKLLNIQGISAAGTIRINRFFKPPFTNDTAFMKKQRGTSEELTTEDNGVTVVKWLDNKCVMLASNFVGVGEIDKAKRWDKNRREYIEVDRPEIVRLYNHAMGGVDLLDQMISHYRISVRSRKWTVRMFSHAIDLAAVCSWMEYRRDAKNVGTPAKEIMDLLHFRLKLADLLIEQDKGVGSGKRRGRPSLDKERDLPAKEIKLSKEHIPHCEVRFDGFHHLPAYDEKKNSTRCKLESCAEKTHIFCVKCKVHLCVRPGRNCFSEFHNI